MKISNSFFTKAIPQVLFIYLIAVCSGSLWFVINPKIIEYIVIFSFFILFFLKKKNRSRYPLFICGLLLAAVVFVRLISGGIGLDSWLLYSSQILVVYCAFYIDEEYFLTRLVRIFTILALISLLAWIIQLTLPSLLEKVLLSRTLLWNKSGTYQTLYKGMYLYVFSNDTRNCGIYSEPGRYQAVLQGALFVILYCPERLKLTRKESIFSAIVLLVAIISTQATTGYFMLAVLLLGYLFITRRQQVDKRMRRVIVGIIVIITSILVLNFVQNGTSSLLGGVVFGKLNNTDIVDMTSSGGARLRMIQLCLESIAKKPWGAGILSVSGNTVAAGYIRLFVAIGVLPALLASIWIFLPVWKSYSSKIPFIVFTVIYIYLGLGQSYAFYPALLAIPIVLEHYNNKPIKKAYIHMKGQRA